MTFKFILFFNLISLSVLAQNTIQTEEMFLFNDSIQLPGTLSYTKTSKAQPLVIFVHGSGNVDRNGNQGQFVNANYIKQLSQALNKNNIAVYRYDKRTATQQNIKFLLKGIKIEAFVEDVQVAITHFKDDKRFSEIILLGHSQGALVAMLAITTDVKKYISLAGPSRPIDEVMSSQLRAQSGDATGKLIEAHFNELKTTGTIANVNPNLLNLFNPANQIFFKSWMSYTPKERIKTLTIPTLILNGTKDLQVSTQAATELHNANPKTTLVLIENMNHVLKTILNDTDNTASYSSSKFPISAKLVEEITTFITQ